MYTYMHESTCKYDDTYPFAHNFPQLFLLGMYGMYIPGVIATTVYLCYLLFVVVYKLVMFMEHG